MWHQYKHPLRVCKFFKNLNWISFKCSVGWYEFHIHLLKSKTENKVPILVISQENNNSNQTYDTPRAAKVPWGMLLKGSLRSPLMLIPAKIPVTVEKNNPIMLKKFSPGRKSGLELLRRLNSEYPMTPCSEKNIHKGMLEILIAKINFETYLSSQFEVKKSKKNIIKML